MLLTPPSGLEGIERTFGVPVIDKSGQLARTWAVANFTLAVLPYPLDNAYLPGLDFSVTRLYCHRLVAPLFLRVFEALLADGLADKARGYGGCVNPRAKRGNPAELSTHSWGIALDLNPTTNQFGTLGDQDPRVVSCFESFGFIWGGRWARPDPMHFQFCKDY